MRSRENDSEAKGSDIGYPNRYRNLVYTRWPSQLLLIDFQDDYHPVLAARN